MWKTLCSSSVAADLGNGKTKWVRMRHFGAPIVIAEDDESEEASSALARFGATFHRFCDESGAADTLAGSDLGHKCTTVVSRSIRVVSRR